jgi:3-phenylpropionate/trans-cinnamate dioxygenase ferredoxin subunit
MDATSGSWKQVAATADVPPGGRKIVRIDGHSLLLFNVDGAVHAIADSCPHAGAWLGAGTLSGLFLRCPAHGLAFDLRTGCARSVQGLTVRVYPVRIAGDAVSVDLSPGPGETAQAARGWPGQIQFP